MTTEQIQSIIDMHYAEIAYCQAHPTDANMNRVSELLASIDQLVQILQIQGELK